MLRSKLFPMWKRLSSNKPRRLEMPDWTEPSGQRTQISVYNPITKGKVPLIIGNENFASWYMCGPTVYDSAHIGHACSYVKFDVIRRILSQHFDINLITVMGITDIDDKIIKRSAESGRDWRELTRFYENEFFTDMAALNVERPFLSCRVSEYIPHIVGFIDSIMERGGAYIGKDGSVYFDTTKHEGYGKLCPPEPDTPCQDKRSSLDFALWKAAKPGEPSWKSPWGRGRPGWHIECSTMASTVFGANIDIHSGGIDLSFPHHENEEAQSCSHHGVTQWVNYWLHSGHLHLKDIKMSKSLGNTLSISELLHGYTANQFRMFCLLSHYRSGVEFTNRTMESAVTILKKIETFVNDCNNCVSGTLQGGNVDDPAILKCLDETKKAVHAALIDDFDTPKAINAITNLVAVGNKMLHQPEIATHTRSLVAIAAVSNYISSTFTKFGITYKGKSKEQSDIKLDDVVDTFVGFRNIVRNRVLEQTVKDKSLLKACDEARTSLSFYGIKIKDHEKNSTWSITEDIKTKI